MDHSHHPGGRRGPFGEALIVISVIVGYFWLFEHGKVSLQGTWEYIGFLAAIVVFYFALIICRIMFFNATRSSSDMPWWAQYEQQKKKSDDAPRKK